MSVAPSLRTLRPSGRGTRPNGDLLLVSVRGLDQHLQGRHYLTGQNFCMADIPAGMTLYRWFEMDIERPANPNVEAWYARLLERPAYQSAICIPFDVV